LNVLRLKEKVAQICMSDRRGTEGVKIHTAVGGLNFGPFFIYRMQVELEPKKSTVRD
jgi:hypothetical protein